MTRKQKWSFNICYVLYYLCVLMDSQRDIFPPYSAWELRLMSSDVRCWECGSTQKNIPRSRREIVWVHSHWSHVTILTLSKRKTRKKIKPQLYNSWEIQKCRFHLHSRSWGTFICLFVCFLIIIFKTLNVYRSKSLWNALESADTWKQQVLFWRHRSMKMIPEASLKRLCSGGAGQGPTQLHVPGF